MRALQLVKHGGSRLGHSKQRAVHLIKAAWQSDRWKGMISLTRTWHSLPNQTHLVLLPSGPQPKATADAKRSGTGRGCTCAGVVG